MSAQTAYNFSGPIGIAGGLYDIAPHNVASRTVEANTGALKPGMGVVVGTAAGDGIALPTSTSTATKFEGVAMNEGNLSYDLEGAIHIKKGDTVGVVTYGKVWVKLAPSVTVAYNDPLVLVITGDNAGCFTKTAASGSAIAVKGRFIGAGKDGIAPAELFNEAQ